MKTDNIPRIPRCKDCEVMFTPGVICRLTANDVGSALERHLAGDWGDLDEFDWKENDAAADSGGRILSRYFSEDGTPFWIVTEIHTEDDRMVTTILLPEEY